MSNPTTLPSDIDGIAEQLHIWYLEAIKHLDPEHYNPKAAKKYSDLKPGQQEIDKYIADKVQNLLASQVAAAREETVKKFAGLMNEMIDIELDEDNKATMHDCVDNAVYIIREKLKEPKT